MVLGFGKKKKPVPEPVVIRTSPSLPELAQQRIPWPKDLVDLDAVYAEASPSPSEQQAGSRPVRTSFQGVRGPVPFHKPFREGTTTANGTLSPKSVAGLFGSGVPPPPSSFPGTGARVRAGSNSRGRRNRFAPTFNVMVAGSKKTGKTSLINLLLDTSTISPGNSQDQLNALQMFRQSSGRPTSSISTATVEILQSAPNRVPGIDDRIALTCIDTPSLDYSEGKELALELSISELVRYIDLLFAETMAEESKVVRTSKGDQHVHLCIYFIDPESIMTPAQRRAKSRLEARMHGQNAEVQPYSEYDSGTDDDGDEDASTGETEDDATSEDAYGEPELAAGKDPMANGTLAAGEAATTTETDADGASEAEDKTPRNSVDKSSRVKPSQVEKSPQSSAQRNGSIPAKKATFEKNRLSMSPAEVRIITRLAKRVNVLPIIARADTLTDSRLERVKRTVYRELAAAGIKKEANIWSVWEAESGKVSIHPGTLETHANEIIEEEEEERQSRPVIKLRGTLRGLTRSRSRKSLKSSVDAELDEPGMEVSPGYPVSSVSAPDGLSIISKRESTNSAKVTENGQYAYGAIFSRADLHARMPFAVIAPERERDGAARKNIGNGDTHDFGVYGRFVRRFRWGTIDVLDPHHCDFAALRAAVLGSYMRSLKTTTKDVLYERFRTEKLLARRATAHLSDSERKQMMKDLEVKPASIDI